MSISSSFKFDFDWISPHMALGGKFPPEHGHFLTALHGITRVVDLRKEARDNEELLSRAGIQLLSLPTPDYCPVSKDQISKGVNWILEAISQDQKVLVHCAEGRGRSVVLACCALIATGQDPLQALNHIKQVRCKISPGLEQLEAVMQWTSEWYSLKNESCPQFQLEDLIDIVGSVYRRNGL